MHGLNLYGLGVALITPFNEDLSIDFKALGNIIEYTVNNGADYLVVLGTTAETPTLSRQEKSEVINFVRQKVNGRIPLVLGLGGNNTLKVVNDIKSYDLEGYSAILSVTPYYNKPNQEGLFQHFMAIAEASPVPVILYNVPTRTGANLTPKTVVKLATSSNKFYGIKEASGDLDQCMEILNKTPDDFKLISGNDADTASIMQMGGIGVISVMANVLPAEMKKLVEICANSQFDEAKLCQEKYSVIIKHLFEDGNPSGVKALLAKKGMSKNLLRLPLVPVSKYVEEKLSRALQLI